MKAGLPAKPREDVGGGGAVARSQVEAGLMMTVWAIAVAFMGFVSGWLVDRYSAGVLGSIGLAMVAAGMALAP